VIEDDLVFHRDERLVRALAALDARFLADTAHPFVEAGGRITLASLPVVYPQARENVLAATKQPSEQSDLLRHGIGRRNVSRN
jgi:hypothetical protein